MKKNYYCLLFIFLIFPGFAFAQREASIWYFGKHSGISFNTSPPTILNDGMIYTDEGCATICDKGGNLQFYTDGVTIYNRNHEVMETGLFGHKSSTQSALIVPNPADKSIFYVFTAGEGGYLYSQNGSINTAAYTIVNMCLNNGLGGVVPGKKNIILKNNVTEKLTAVLHQNGADVWVMYHEWKSDIFSAFIVTGDGVNPNAINSACGIVHKPYFYPDIPLNPYEYLYTTYNTLGQMKFSPQGNKIALAVARIAHIELFDFDNLSGKVSNAQVLLHQTDNKGTQGLTYGVEFSPDGSQLYATESLEDDFSHYLGSYFFKFDLTSGKKDLIIKSKSYINYAQVRHGAGFGGLQLSPDGKLYSKRAVFATTDTIGVINNPNLTAVKDINYKEVGLIATITRPPKFPEFPDYNSADLPNFITSYFDPSPKINLESSCYDGVVSFNVINCNTISKVSWDFGNLTSGNENNSESLNPIHIYKTPGTYQAKADITLNDGKTIQIQKKIYVNYLPKHFLGNDTTLGIGETIKLDLSTLNGFYNWQDGSNSTLYEINKPGIYWVDVCKSGCSIRDSIIIKCKTYSIDLGPDRIICDEKPITLDASITGGNYKWQNGSSGSSFSASLTGKYYVTAENSCAKLSDTIFLTFEKLPKLSLFDTTICYGKRAIIDLSYLEKQGYSAVFEESKTSAIEISKAGKVNYTISSSQCIYQYSIDVKYTECKENMMVPNVFTPDGDPQHLNETFELVGFEKGKWALTVFNRLGKEVYRNNAYANEWRGEGLSTGIYYYFLQDSKSEACLKGWVEILR